MNNPFDVIEARLSNIENLLLDMKHPAKVSEPIQDRIDLNDACQLTGSSKSQLYKLTMLNEIPHQKFGKRLIFSRKELTAWMESRTVTPVNPDHIMTDRLQRSANRKLLKR